VPDRDMPGQDCSALVEDLADQAHVLVDEHLLAVAGRDAGRLLPAVLQRIEPEVGEFGDVLAGRPDAEDPTGVLWALLPRQRSWVSRPSPRATLHGLTGWPRR
jgi:hypothetical protein